MSEETYVSKADPVYGNKLVVYSWLFSLRVLEQRLQPTKQIISTGYYSYITNV
jgi:hypothetical protein